RVLFRSLAEDGRGQLTHGVVPGRAGGEAQLVERVDVVLQRDALLRAGDERGVHRRRQPPLGAPLRNGDGFEPGIAHDGSRFRIVDASVSPRTGAPWPAS